MDFINDMMGLNDHVYRYIKIHNRYGNGAIWEYRNMEFDKIDYSLDLKPITPVLISYPIKNGTYTNVELNYDDKGNLNKYSRIDVINIKITFTIIVKMENGYFQLISIKQDPNDKIISTIKKFRIISMKKAIKLHEDIDIMTRIEYLFNKKMLQRYLISK